MTSDEATYYTSRQPELLARFEQEAGEWPPLLAESDGDAAAAIVAAARRHFCGLIPALPYIGGDAHPWTGLLVRAAIALALYRAMLAHGKDAAAAGRAPPSRSSAAIRAITSTRSWKATGQPSTTATTSTSAQRTSSSWHRARRSCRRTSASWTSR